MPKPSSASLATATSGLPKIHAISQQSRFHTETLESAQGEIDLKGVTISIGDNELIVDSRLKLKAGVRYALVGRYARVSLPASDNRLMPCLPLGMGPESPVRSRLILEDLAHNTTHRPLSIAAVYCGQAHPGSQQITTCSTRGSNRRWYSSGGERGRDGAAACCERR